MKNSSLFQTILLIVFGGAILVGVLIFAGILPGFKSAPVGVAGTVTLWGTIPTNRISNFIEKINKANESQFKIVYVAKERDKIGEELLEALASDNAPDLVLLPQDLIFHYRDKIYPVPFTTLTQRQYGDNFVDGAKIFETVDGYLALPVAVDPLVLYYNKDLYKAVNLVTPPASWEEFVLNQPKLTVFDNLNKLVQSATALGTSNNIKNFKDIYALLSMQSGVKPIEFDGSKLYPNLLSGVSGGFNSSQLALDFYNQFSNPERSTYCWNRSLPLDRDYFLAGKLANYFGLASELPYILEKNPHLNFDTASVPRLNKGANLTLGHFSGLAVMKKTTKASTAFASAFALAFSTDSQQINQFLDAYPVKRSLIQKGDPNARRQIFFNEALVSSTWADPDTKKTDTIISQMISNSALGQTGAVKKASEDLQLLLAE